MVFEFASHHGGSWLDHLYAAGSRLAGDGEQADLVVDVHGIVHEPEVGERFRLRAERLAPGGLLVMEFHHLLPLFVGNQFDTIRHGHWSYQSLRAVGNLAALYGLAVESVRHVDMFGGSLMVMLRHTADAKPDASVDVVLADEEAAGIADEIQLASLQEAAWHAAAALHYELTRHKAAGRTVLGYGAPSKAPVLLDLSKVGTDLLAFTVDNAPGKHGRRIPGGCMVPIRPVEDLKAARPDVVLVLTWDIADEVIAQLEADGGWGATYLVPLPEPHELRRHEYLPPPPPRSAMQVEQVAGIAGALIFRPTPHADERGFFCRTFDRDVVRSVGIDPDAFVQDSVSRSRPGCAARHAPAVRSRRGQAGAVLVRRGVRRGRRPAAGLTDLPQPGALRAVRRHTRSTLYIPAGCAHGFQALTDPADVSYRIDRAHDPAEDVTIVFDDPELAIPWPLPVALDVRAGQGGAVPRRCALRRADVTRSLRRSIEANKRLHDADPGRRAHLRQG